VISIFDAVLGAIISNDEQAAIELDAR